MSILVAVELSRKKDEKVIRKALELAKKRKAELSLVHVVNPIYNFGMMSSQILIDCLQRHEAYARKKVSELGFQFKVPKESQFIKVGHVKEVITDLINIIDADLLVVGNYTRPGFDSLFHKNNAVSLIKHTDCDMLTVRVA